MASQKKKLQSKAVKFLREHPAQYAEYSRLVYGLARLILKSGATEVAVGYRNGEYYESTND